LVAGGVLSTVTVAVSLAVFPRPSVIVARIEWVPSATAVESHGESMGFPSTVSAIAPGPTALVAVVWIGVEPRTNVHEVGEVS
jgi:hypothetical protein